MARPVEIRAAARDTDVVRLAAPCGMHESCERVGCCRVKDQRVYEYPP